MILPWVTLFIHSPGGHLQPDLVGGGLGFGDLIEGLPWRRLTP